mgnify:CR=1 FL=1
MRTSTKDSVKTLDDTSLVWSGSLRPGTNVAIVTAYNDMLSAHVPFAGYPETLKKAVLGAGGIAQVAELDGAGGTGGLAGGDDRRRILHHGIGRRTASPAAHRRTGRRTRPAPTAASCRPAS